MCNCTSEVWSLRPSRIGVSPIAVEVTVAVIVTAAVIAAGIGNAEYAVHRADGAANAGADLSANGPADRTGNPIAFIGAFLRAAHDTLRMSDMRDREQR